MGYKWYIGITNKRMKMRAAQMWNSGAKPLSHSRKGREGDN